MRGNMNGRRVLPELPVSREKLRVPLSAIVLGFVAALFGRLVVSLFRHPIAVGLVVGLAAFDARYGPHRLAVMVVVLAGLAVVWRFGHRRSFGWVARRARGRVRLALIYRPRWRNAMIESELAIRRPKTWGERITYNEILPRIRAIRSDRVVDRLRIELLYGQTPEQWEEQAEALRHVFRARRCQVRQETSRFIWLDLYFRESLTHVVTRDDLDPPEVDLAGLPIGRQEDGQSWRLNILGTHVLVAGATGAGKGSVIWSVVRALGPAVRAGTVELWVADPKGGMEMAFGAPMFTRFAVDLPAIVDMLDDAVTLMRERAERLRGITRLHQPTADDPLIVVILDEIASLTSYVHDRDLKRRLGASLPLLLSQGRAPGVVVLGAIQDPRKETLPFRDLFPTRIALRMTEPDQVDLVLGDGARNRGARADEIPTRLAGVGYVQHDGQPEPTRVRACWLDDDEIRATARSFQPRAAVRPDPVGGWVPDVHGEAA
ncbi:MAG: FtsK/SpoIIIE domain-containing protein [Frankia sp.]